MNIVERQVQSRRRKEHSGLESSKKRGQTIYNIIYFDGEASNGEDAASWNTLLLIL